MSGSGGLYPAPAPDPDTWPDTAWPPHPHYPRGQQTSVIRSHAAAQDTCVGGVRGPAHAAAQDTCLGPHVSSWDVKQEAASSCSSDEDQQLPAGAAVKRYKVL